ncbi:TPA: head-tail connector protein [Bacillus luti]
MLLDVQLAKKWLRLEEEDTEEDDILGLLIENAEIYVKKAVGKHYNATEENRKQSQKIALVLVTNWYDNRDLSGQADEKVRYTIKSMVLQLQLSEETV